MSKKIVITTSIGVVLLLAGAVLYALGYLYAGIKDPAQKVTLTDGKVTDTSTAKVYSVVCGTSIVNRYNALSLPLSISGKEQLKVLATDVQRIPTNQDDPTCQTILFFAGLLSNNKANATEAFERVEALYNKGYYVNSKLRNTYTVDTMKDVLQRME